MTVEKTTSWINTGQCGGFHQGGHHGDLHQPVLHGKQHGAWQQRDTMVDDRIKYSFVDHISKYSMVYDCGK